LIIGGHYRISKDWQAGLGAGPGITRGFGSPKLRVLASLEYYPDFMEKKAPPPPPADRDKDGILDKDDACIDVPGIASPDPKKHGCPPPKDSDGDGIIDEKDACPQEAGIPSEDPKKHGCPVRDKDKDGILDEVDACVDVPGIANEDPKKNGCPPPKDTDGDTIMDDVDACPNEKGEANKDPKKHGCPKAIIRGTEVKILERVEFDTGLARIRKESDPVLQAVLKIMKEHPEITKLSVEGHTDNKGSRFMNLSLSKRRAASVVSWLIKNGVDKKRLSSNGFGPDKAIDTNDTPEGRQNNRRVEFHIVEMKGNPSTEIKNK
jgi:OmpA-OmpF porin, OOP family